MNNPKVYCKFLRAKNAYGTLEGVDHNFIPIDPGTTFYWCIQTMGPAGPDSRLAHISSCANSQRKCFAAKDNRDDQDGSA